MGKIDIAQIKRLRKETGAGILDIKNALQEAGGAETKAKEILRKKGFEKAEKKEQRDTAAGVVESYIHSNNTTGATVVLLTETDFVARNKEFKNLAREIAMQITAMDPTDIDELLSQPYIRDESKTIKELIKQYIAKFGENIKIKEFRRFKV